MPETPAADVVALAQERADARARRDWTEADRLRAEIEAAGWTVVDEGTSFALAPAHPADVVVGGRTRYGRSSSVPSRLGEPSAGMASVVLLAGDDPTELTETVAALRRHVPAATGIVIVADAPSPAVEAVLDAVAPAGVTPGDTGDASDRDDVATPVEAVSTSERLGIAAALNAGIRRAIGPIVVLLRTPADVSGDLVTPLARSLDDPGVAVAGGCGMVTRDLRHLATAGPGPVDALGLDSLAFRRADHLARGPLDEGLRTDEYLALWWSLVLRDEGGAAPPRRAVALEGLPLGRPCDGEPREGPDEGEPSGGRTGRARSERRDYYRVLERFRGREDLLRGHP